MQDLIFNYLSTLWQPLSSTPPYILVQAVILTFVLLLWVGTIFFALRDSRRRESGIVLPALALMLTTLLPFLGVFVYFLLRPQMLLHDRQMQRLEAQLAQAQLRGDGHCHACLTPVSEEFRYCPACCVHLKQRCPVCKHLVRTHFRHCPTCQYELPASEFRAHDHQIGLAEFGVHTDRIIQVGADALIEPAEGKQFLSTYLAKLPSDKFESIEVQGKTLYMQVFEAHCQEFGRGSIRFVVLADSPDSVRHNRVVLAATETRREPLEIIHHSLRAA